MDAASRVAPRAVGSKPSGAELVQDGFCHDRPCRVAGAQEQDVVRGVRHAGELIACSTRWPPQGSAGGAARLILHMSNARHPLSSAITIVGALAGGQKGFPGDACGIIDPRLFRSRVAASSLSLLSDAPPRPCAAARRPLAAPRHPLPVCRGDRDRVAAPASRLQNLPVSAKGRSRDRTGETPRADSGAVADSFS